MYDIKEIEKTIDTLLKQYDNAVKTGKLTDQANVAIQIERELNKLNTNEIKVITC
jgi:hypothetical protein